MRKRPLCDLICFLSGGVRRAGPVFLLLAACTFLEAGNAAALFHEDSLHEGVYAAGGQHWEENALFTLPSAPPVPFETTVGNFSSDSPNQQVLLVPLGFTHCYVSLRKKKNQAPVPQFSLCQRSKTSMSRASEACLIFCVEL